MRSCGRCNSSRSSSATPSSARASVSATSGSGSLAAVGRIDPATYAADPSLAVARRRRPVRARARRRGHDGSAGAPWGGRRDRGLRSSAALGRRRLELARSADRDRGGGTTLGARVPNVRLVFLGLGHPSPAVDTMSMADRAVALATRSGVEGRHVFFSREWVPYRAAARLLPRGRSRRERASRHRRRPASRSGRGSSTTSRRGRRVVTTSGDVLAELVAARGLGRVVAPGDVEGWVGALQELLAHRAELKTAPRATSRARAPSSHGRRVAGPLFRLVDAAPAPVRRRADVAIGRTACRGPPVVADATRHQGHGVGRAGTAVAPSGRGARLGGCRPAPSCTSKASPPPSPPSTCWLPDREGRAYRRRSRLRHRGLWARSP